MGKFVHWLNTAHNLHPVRHAALAHYKLVFIHPFMDGNGRTSRYVLLRYVVRLNVYWLKLTNLEFRLLMNLILMRAGFPPVIIRRADR